MSGAQRVRLFRERRKVDAARSVNNASTSTIAEPETMNIASEDDTRGRLEMMDLNISRIGCVAGPLACSR